MHVVKVAEPGPGEPRVQLVSDQGEPVAEANGFLRLLAVRGYSPNTVRAYAHDLQKLFTFLDRRGLGRRFHPGQGSRVPAMAAAGFLSPATLVRRIGRELHQLALVGAAGVLDVSLWFCIAC